MQFAIIRQDRPKVSTSSEFLQNCAKAHKKSEMLLAMNRNDTIGFNSQYRGFTMEELKQAAKADTSEASGDGIQPTEYDVLFGRGKVRAQKQS